MSAPPSSWKQIWALMATVFVDMVGFAMVLPLLAFYAKDLGATDFAVAAMVAAHPFAQFAASPFWGRLSDRFGRRPLILAGLMASTVAYVIFGLADAIWLLFLSRLVQGTGGGTTGVVQAYVADSVPPEDRAQALGWVTVATSAGVMIGPVVGSLAAHFDPHAPGFVAAGLCLANILFAWRWLPESRRESVAEPGVPARERQPLRHTMSEVLRHPTAPISALIWIYTVGMMAFMAMNGVLALYLREVFGVTKETIGWFFLYVGGLSLLIRAFVLGPAVRRFGEVGVTRLGALSLVVGLALLPLPGPGNLVGLGLAVLFVPAGTALLFPATTALVSRYSRREETGQTLGVQQSFGSLSRMLGPLWVGAVYQGVGIQYPFWIAAGLMLGVSFLTRRLPNGVPASERKVEPVVDRA